MKRYNLAKQEPLNILGSTEEKFYKFWSHFSSSRLQEDESTLAQHLKWHKNLFSELLTTRVDSQNKLVDSQKIIEDIFEKAIN